MLFQRLFHPDKNKLWEEKCFIWSSWYKLKDPSQKTGMRHRREKSTSPKKNSIGWSVCCVSRRKMPTAAAHTRAQKSTMCSRHDTGLADLIGLRRNKSIIKRTRPPTPTPDKEGRPGGTLITTSEWKKEPTINRMWIIQTGFCFQLDIESYRVDILETVSWWHLGDNYSNLLLRSN